MEALGTIKRYNQMKQYIVKVYEDRTEWYNEQNQLDREDGPAIECANGTKLWYRNDQIHRDDGPAIEDTNGNKWWYRNYQLHREGGPAVEYANGNKSWYLNGQRHRKDGPAIECADGTKWWYLNGQNLSEEEFNQRTSKPVSDCSGKVVEIDGKKYKLTLI
jgi:hypothetical protein